MRYGTRRDASGIPALRQNALRVCRPTPLAPLPLCSSPSPFSAASCLRPLLPSPVTTPPCGSTPSNNVALPNMDTAPTSAIPHPVVVLPRRALLNAALSAALLITLTSIPLALRLLNFPPHATSSTSSSPSSPSTSPPPPARYPFTSALHVAHLTLSVAALALLALSAAVPLRLRHVCRPPGARRRHGLARAAKGMPAPPPRAALPASKTGMRATADSPPPLSAAQLGGALCAAGAQLAAHALLVAAAGLALAGERTDLPPGATWLQAVDAASIALLCASAVCVAHYVLEAYEARLAALDAASAAEAELGGVAGVRAARALRGAWGAGGGPAGMEVEAEAEAEAETEAVAVAVGGAWAKGRDAEATESDKSGVKDTRRFCVSGAGGASLAGLAGFFRGATLGRGDVTADAKKTRRKKKKKGGAGAATSPDGADALAPVAGNAAKGDVAVAGIAGGAAMRHERGGGGGGGALEASLCTLSFGTGPGSSRGTGSGDQGGR